MIKGPTDGTVYRLPRPKRLMTILLTMLLTGTPLIASAKAAAETTPTPTPSDRLVGADLMNFVTANAPTTYRLSSLVGNKVGFIAFGKFKIVTIWPREMSGPWVMLNGKFLCVHDQAAAKSFCYSVYKAAGQQKDCPYYLVDWEHQAACMSPIESDQGTAQ